MEPGIHLVEIFLLDSEHTVGEWDRVEFIVGDSILSLRQGKPSFRWLRLFVVLQNLLHRSYLSLPEMVSTKHFP